MFCICRLSRSTCAQKVVTPTCVVPKTGDQVFRPINMIKYADYLVINASTAILKKDQTDFYQNLHDKPAICALDAHQLIR